MAATDPETLRELVAALKHDLAKYVAWRSANFDDEAWTGPMPDELAEALRADLLTTKGDEAASAVWDRVSAELDRPLQYAELQEVADAVDSLRPYEKALRAGDRDAVSAGRAQIRAAQNAIRSALKALHAKLLRG